jgi:hypothetical protein
MRRFTPLVVRTMFLAGLLVMGACPVHGQVPAVRAPMWAWPYDPTLMPYGGYWIGPCYPFASCWSYQQFLILERRRARFEELARGQQPPLPAQNGFPPNRHDDNAKTFTDADVLPAFIESGQVREEYQESGDYLPEFLHGKGR